MNRAAAGIRVYLFTYRRHALLPRALKSLLDQTYTNWICELHNDDPADPFPGELVQRIGDPRVRYVRHERNLGPTPTFNLAFGPVAEPFASILEDDNWWEPRLLERLHDALAARPAASVAWANMWLWQEGDDNRWEKVGSIWPTDLPEPVTTIAESHPRQVCGALHSNGAMLARTANIARYVIPDSTPFFAIEPVRERLFERPLIRLNEPLANFALTRTTFRTETADENLQVLTVLAMAALPSMPRTTSFYRAVWSENRGSRGHRQRALVAAGIKTGRIAELLRGASFADLAIVGGWIARHPRRFARILAAPDRFPELSRFLQALPGTRNAA